VQKNNRQRRPEENGQAAYEKLTLLSKAAFFLKAALKTNPLPNPSSEVDWVTFDRRHPGDFELAS